MALDVSARGQWNLNGWSATNNVHSNLHDGHF